VRSQIWIAYAQWAYRESSPTPNRVSTRIVPSKTQIVSLLPISTDLNAGCTDQLPRSVAAALRHCYKYGLSSERDEHVYSQHFCFWQPIFDKHIDNVQRVDCISDRSRSNKQFVSIQGFGQRLWKGRAGSINGNLWLPPYCNRGVTTLVTL
jgi:hypothetical protein